MSRRLRREFQGLEAQLEPEVQAKQWRTLIDMVLYNKGPGPKPIVEQLRLREKLRTLHARRDRYNFKRYNRRYEALLQRIKPRHVLATLAIRSGMVEPAEGACPRDMLVCARRAGRRRRAGESGKHGPGRTDSMPIGDDAKVQEISANVH